MTLERHMSPMLAYRMFNYNLNKNGIYHPVTLEFEMNLFN